jgi:hypothetical protein
MSGFGNWTSEIGPIENKLKDKHYKGHGESCPRMDNHANGMAHSLCHLRDFLFLGMICRGLYNFCLLACFLWGLFWLFNFQIRIVLCIFYTFLDTLPMIVFSSSNSILIKSYKILCRPSLPGALRVLLELKYVWQTLKPPLPFMG